MVRLFWLVFSLTALSFGGGNMILVGLERELVQAGMITPQLFAAAVALGQATPGPMAAYAAAIGLAVAGVGGAVAAMGAMLLVSLGSISLIARVPRDWFQLGPVQGALESVAPLATAILIYLGVRMLMGEGGVNPAGLAIALGAMVAKLRRWPITPVMAGAVLAGMLLHG